MIVLHIDFQVTPAQADAFEALYRTGFAPAVSRQQGFQATKLVRLFPAQANREIGATIPAGQPPNRACLRHRGQSPRLGDQRRSRGRVPAPGKPGREVAWCGYDVVHSVGA